MVYNQAFEMNNESSFLSQKIRKKQEVYCTEMKFLASKIFLLFNFYKKINREMSACYKICILTLQITYIYDNIFHILNVQKQEQKKKWE